MDEEQAATLAAVGVAVKALVSAMATRDPENGPAHLAKRVALKHLAKPEFADAERVHEIVAELFSLVKLKADD